MSLSVTQTGLDDEAESAAVSISVEQNRGKKNRGKKRSFVWTIFKDLEGQNLVLCTKCKDTLAFRKKSGTTHLRRHILEGCKCITYEERQKIIGSLEKDPFDPSTFKFDPELTRFLLTLLFIDAEIPFAAVNSRFWEPALRSLRPEYRAVKWQTLRNDCVEVFKSGCDALMAEFAALDSRVCFTSDIWTSGPKLAYLCLTAHYIDSDFKLHKRIIAFRQIPYPHTGQAICNLIEQILMDWDLNGKLLTLTLDNCSTNDNAVNLLENKLWEKSGFVGGSMHMRCTAHILNILVQDGVSVIKEAVKRIRELIAYTSYPSRLQLFNTIAAELKLKPRKGLILDCPTRWNSTFEMLNQALEYKEALSRFAADTPMQVPSLEDWKEAEVIVNYLSSFASATQTFSASKRPNSHTYIKEIWGIRQLVFDEDLKSNGTLRNLSREMQRKFIKYWQNPNMLLTLACVLDPRYKLMFLKFCFESAYGEEEAGERIQNVVTLLKAYYDRYARPTTSQDSEQASASSTITSRGGVGKSKLELQFDQYKTQNHCALPSRSELETYLDAPLENGQDENFDILHWWKKNSELYPTLAKMARDFLAIPVTTVASESVFSSAGRLTDNLRNCLNVETIECLICSKDWFGPHDISFDLEQYRHLMPNINDAER